MRAAGLDPQRVQDWTRAQCVQGLILMEEAARAERLHLVRDVGTGWRDFVPACFEPAHSVQACTWIHWKDVHSQRGREPGED